MSLIIIINFIACLKVATDGKFLISTGNKFQASIVLGRNEPQYILIFSAWDSFKYYLFRRSCIVPMFSGYKWRK